MKKFSWLPSTFRDFLVSSRNRYRTSKGARALTKLSQRPVKRIIVGAGGTNFEGWEPTDKEVLNLLRESDWHQFFELGSLDAILAEHVWEHLSPEEAATAAGVCFTFLKQGGYLRVAVPDGLHPDSSYIDGVKPGGNGSGADDHKVLYTYKTFGEIFVAAGFKISLLEYFDEQGKFHQTNWNPKNGLIRRSQRFDVRNVGGNPVYTSIILDAKKN